MPSSFDTNKTGKRKNIFISYRVSDTAGETGRLVDTLKSYFYEDQIFMDIDKLEPGVDFTEVIAKSLEQCDILLAVIGRAWEGNIPGSTQSRLKQANDWVRLELSTALKRNIKVVPILVDGGTLPEPEDLPEDLHPLLRRQSYEISNKRWKYDTDQLVQHLVKSGINLKYSTPPKKAESKMSTGIKILIGGLAILGLLAVIGLLLPQEQKENSGKQIEPVYTKTDSVPKQDNTYNENDNIVEEPAKPVTTSYADVAGSWNESKGLYYMIIMQNGKSITAQSYSPTGAQTGEGSGTINGDNLTLRMNIYGTGYISIKASLSPAGDALNGNYHIEANGATYTEPLMLLKQY